MTPDGKFRSGAINQVRGFRTRDAHYGSAQFMWEPDAFPAAYPPGVQLSGECDGAPDGYLAGDEDELQGDDEEVGLCALAGELGLDVDDLLQLAGDDDELGFSLKKLAKGIGKGLKKAVKVAAPILKVTGAVLAFVVPPAGVSLMAVGAGADKLISAAEKGSKAAKQAYSATKALAAKGHPHAIAALDVLQKVQQKRRQEGVKPGQPSSLQHGVATQALKAEASKLLVKVAPKVTASAAATGTEEGFFVTHQGRVRHGRYKAA